MTLEKMLQLEKEGRGRIYWYYKDRTYGSDPRPLWFWKTDPDFNLVFSPH